MEQVRRMRGGAQSHLMRCSDGYYYVVKFQNNPQHKRVLVNELLGTRLASCLGLPTTQAEVIEVHQELISWTPDLSVEMPRTRVPCQPGKQFGSRYPGDPRRSRIEGFLPDEQLRCVPNLHDFGGMLIFDKWTCNTDGRQVIFPRDPQRSERHLAMMIDQGFCFNAGEWNYPDAPLRGLYTQHCVYDAIIGMESLEPWLDQLETAISEDVLEKIIEDIPSEWYDDDLDPLYNLLERLLRRRARLPELLISAKRSDRHPFRNWD